MLYAQVFRAQAIVDMAVNDELNIMMSPEEIQTAVKKGSRKERDSQGPGNQEDGGGAAQGPLNCFGEPRRHLGLDVHLASVRSTLTTSLALAGRLILTIPGNPHPRADSDVPVSCSKCVRVNVESGKGSCEPLPVSHVRRRRPQPNFESVNVIAHYQICKRMAGVFDNLY